MLLHAQVDENTVSALPSNFFVNNLLATMTMTNDTSAAKKILCDNCESEDSAQCRCNDCGIFLCQFCTESHKRSRSTKQHEMLTMEELKSNPGPQRIADKIRCPKHKDEIIKLFCKTCQTTICRDCTIVDHRQHEYGFVEDVAVEKRQHLQSNLEEVKERKERVVQGLVNLKKFSKSLEAKKMATVSEIEHHFDQLVKAVESRKMEMVEKATSHTNLKQKQIHGQLEALEVALASCDSSIEFTERAFKSGNDVQILSMEKYILQSLEQLKAAKDQTNPCVTGNMMFIIPSSVQETKETLLNQYDVDVSVESPENCQASFEDKEMMFHAGKQYSITLICHDKDNRRLRYGGQDVKPLFTGMEVSDVAVTDNNDGSYSISFCPRQGGMLKFMVSINGIPAPNCSLTKQVKWVISDAHGKGVVTHGGFAMQGVWPDGEYCCRVGNCYFETGVHSWSGEVSFVFNRANSGNREDNLWSGHDMFRVWACLNQSVEVGIIDYDEINADIVQCQKKWVHELAMATIGKLVFFCTLDMERKTLNVQIDSNHHRTLLGNYQFTACRVSPFFACHSPNVVIHLRA